MEVGSEERKLRSERLPLPIKHESDRIDAREVGAEPTCLCALRCSKEKQGWPLV
jgi:hypothetical protein